MNEYAISEPVIFNVPYLFFSFRLHTFVSLLPVCKVQYGREIFWTVILKCILSCPSPVYKLKCGGNLKCILFFVPNQYVYLSSLQCLVSENVFYFEDSNCILSCPSPVCKEKFVSLTNMLHAVCMEIKSAYFICI